MRKKFIVNPATNQYESVDFELNKTGSDESLSSMFKEKFTDRPKDNTYGKVKPKDLPNKFNTDLVKAKQNAYKTLSPKDPALAWVEYTNHKYNNEPDTPETRKRFVENAVQLSRVPMYKSFVEDTLKEITPPKEFNSVDRSTYPMNQTKELDAWEIIESTMTPIEKRKFYTEKAKTPAMKKLMTPKELKFVDKPKAVPIDYSLNRQQLSDFETIKNFSTENTRDDETLNKLMQKSEDPDLRKGIGGLLLSEEKVRK